MRKALLVHALVALTGILVVSGCWFDSLPSSPGPDGDEPEEDNTDTEAFVPESVPSFVEGDRNMTASVRNSSVNIV